VRTSETTNRPNVTDASDFSAKRRHDRSCTLGAAMSLPSKSALKDELTRVLEEQLSTLAHAYQATCEAATHEEAKPENDKDTRALEQSYVARGQAQRVEEVRAGLADARAMPTVDFAPGRPAALGAVVVVEENDRRLTFLLASYGGGITLCDGAVQVVTTKSPLGRGLLGKRAGDECEMKVGDRMRELVVVAVR
jgi:transcription elongation GreA/GreB family factor